MEENVLTADLIPLCGQDQLRNMTDFVLSDSTIQLPAVSKCINNVDWSSVAILAYNDSLRLLCY